MIHFQERQANSQLQKRNQNHSVQSIDSDVKHYRSLLSLYIDNIHTIIKSHKDIFNDMDPPNKIKISKEEQVDSLENVSRYYQKVGWKLARDALQRNQHIKKVYEEYAKEYQEKNICPQTLQQKYDENQQSALIFKTIDFKYQNKSNTPKNTISMKQTQSKRPLSSKQVVKNPNPSKLLQIYNQFQTINFSQIYKMKTISPDLAQNTKKRDQSFMLGSNRSMVKDQRLKSRTAFYQTCKRSQFTKRYPKESQKNELFFEGNQIMIFQKSKQKNKQKPNLETRFQSQKICVKRVVNSNDSHRRSIDEIQKMQLQNRIFKTNNIFSINLSQSQGYRPKSKCWQNFFN